MNTWVIETSTEKGLIAFLENERIYFFKHLPFGYNQSKYLMPELQMACQSLNLIPPQVDCIGVGIGPGSYTGIRIGVSVAKSLAYAWQLPLIGFCSLAAFIPEKEGSFAAIIDAKIGGAYFLKGILAKGKIEYTSEPQVCPLEQLGHHLNDVNMIVTPSSKILKSKVDQLYPKSLWQWMEVFPNVQHIGSLIQQKYKNKEWAIDGRLDLLYLRKTEAERNRESERSF